MAPLLDPAGADAVLLPSEVARLSGLPLSRAARCSGVCLVEGFTRQAAALGGPDDLVAYARGTWVFADPAVLRLPTAALRALLDHEIAHVRAPGWTEARIAEAFPLPDLSVLRTAAVVGPLPAHLRGLTGRRLVVGGGRASFMPRLSHRDESVDIDPSARPDIVGDVAAVALPAQRYQEVYFEYQWPGAFTGPRIGALAEAWAALEPGGTLVVIAGGSVRPHLPGIESVLRRLGARSISISGAGTTRS